MHTLPGLIASGINGVHHRILGLTRSLSSPASQSLAKLPNVELLEKDWTTIDAAWLRAQDVARVYIAPHNLPHQFVDESALHIALLRAGVQYVGPTNPVYYGRSHRGIETLLSQPEFKATGWLDDHVTAGVFPASLIPPFMAGFETLYDRRCSTLEKTPTSKEVQALAPPRRTIADALNAVLEA